MLVPQSVHHGSQVLQTAVGVVLVEVGAVQLGGKGRAVNVIGAHDGHLNEVGQQQGQQQKEENCSLIHNINYAKARF